ncbi:hypothetical protein [Cellulomonas sp. H30R-01]|uniref:hypothetical protein n=1 Tax=Cellulomonas sp. H30R-01 TaxID=2704467 RepID=UPI001EE3DA35|nr:hypothetical protein [Cellulomonas sp. H30R-01]
MNTPGLRGRTALMVPVAVALLAGLDAALVLLGLPAPVTTQRLPDVHGALMVLGFVGALVALERAVAVGRLLGYAAPALLGLGGLLLLSPLPLVAGRVAQLGGTVVLVGLYRAVWRRQPAAAVAVQGLGALMAVGAAVLWLGDVPVPRLVPWWVGFLVLTVAGERLELLRVAAPPPVAERGVVGAALAFPVAAALALLWPTAGYAALGVALLVLVGFLVRYDVARRTARATGLPRFMAVAMLAGYGWLGVAGTLWLVGGPQLAGPGYDAVLHAVFLGFVISMVMAHAPVILPAVLRRPLPYRPLMYGPLVALHVTLALRVAVGDARDLPVVVQVGGVGNILAVLAFPVVAALSARAARRPRPGPATADGHPDRPVAVTADPATGLPTTATGADETPDDDRAPSRPPAARQRAQAGAPGRPDPAEVTA